MLLMNIYHYTMNRLLFYPLLCLSLLLAACSVDREAEHGTVNPATVNPDSIPMAFNAYAHRGTSRSGWAGVTRLNSLQQPKEDGGGFGVFAYYTDLKKYDQTYVPNLMYNQGVFYNTTVNLWDYNPIVYWPNEYGFDAYSDDEDKVSFFAYAPYVENVSAAAGSVDDPTYGIIGFSRNNATGDPMVRYKASFNPAQSVDLCWGVCDETSWGIIQNSSAQTMTPGLPWLDVEHPAGINQRLKFTFHHALSQLNVQIDTDADVIAHSDADAVDASTKVYVRSISFTGIAMEGALNLNNVVPNEALWLDWCGCTDLNYGQSVTVHDGRRNGREGAPGAEALNEVPVGLNPNIIQTNTPTDGVTSQFQNLFAPASLDPAQALTDAVCVIPTGEAMTITIVYDIETANPNLAGYLSDGVTHGVSIENKITKTVTFGDELGAGLQNNHMYTLKLHLGMNSIKFDADVSDWDYDNVNGDEWLPGNTTPIMLNKNVVYCGPVQNLIAATDPAGQEVTWYNSNPEIATFENLTATAIEITPVAIGATTITASIPSGKTASCIVYVVPIVIKSPSTDWGTEISEKVSVGGNFIVSYNLTFPSGLVPTWTSSDESIATVDASGNVTGVAPGTCTITATVGELDPQTATCEVTVVNRVPIYTPPTIIDGLVYNQAAQQLINPGIVTGGTMWYKVGSGEWSTAIPTATDAGSYTIYYKINGTGGYVDVPEEVLVDPAVINKATPTVTLTANNIYVKTMKRWNSVNASTTNTDGGAGFSVSSSDNTKVSATVSGGVVTVRGQGSAGQSATITVTSVETDNYNAASASFTAQVEGLAATMNPLYYVAEYNVTGAPGSYVMGTQNDDNYFYIYSNAVAAGTAIAGYHLPSQAEWLSIIPADWYGHSETIPNYSGARTSTVNEAFGYNATTKAGMQEKSYWWKVSSTEVRAIRFIGTDYCSAWRYVWAGTSGNNDGENGYRLEVSSCMIDCCLDYDEAIALYNSGTGWAAPNIDFNGAGTTPFYAQNRRFYARGNRATGQGSAAAATRGAGQNGYFWSSTTGGDGAWNMHFLSGYAHLYTDSQAFPFSVRLFRDN